MKKNKKRIILSITAITLILLILVGLTYAYFLTNIQGNTNNKSISVDTANLALAYGDGNGSIVGTTVAPGTVIGTKTFTVTNTGNVTVSYGVFLEDVINDLERTSDLQLTITCSSSIQSKTCSGYNGDMPYQNDILLSNTLGIGETQTYSLTLEYIEPNVDQSVDMGKSISAKVQIYEMSGTVDLEGTITDANEGDYVVVNSVSKESQIRSDKTFKVVGLEPGSHTISIYNSSDTLRYSKQIIINRGSSELINGTTITVTENTRKVVTTISSSSLSILKIANDITITSSSGNSISTSATTTLTATLSPIDAVDSTITWSASGNNIVSFSNNTTNVTNGTSTVTVTGVNAGTTTIIARSEYGFTKTYSLEVQTVLNTSYYSSTQSNASIGTIQYLDGMTWGDWLESTYNNSNWESENGNIKTPVNYSGFNSSKSNRSLIQVSTTDPIYSSLLYVVSEHKMCYVDINSNEDITFVLNAETPSDSAIIVFQTGNTWNDWILSSSYNTLGWSIDNDVVKTNISGGPTAVSVSNTSPSATIISKHNYFSVSRKLKD